MQVAKPRRRVFVLGATGTIGVATVRALIAQGDDVVCLIRARSGRKGGRLRDDGAALLVGATVRFGTPTDAALIARDGICGERFDAIVSCLASRTGTPRDAWAVDHDANVAILAAARAHGIPQFVLLSAICVQRPLLAFQHAKLAFEAKLIASGLRWSIVRPTAYFKSLSGQIDRVRRGKPFLVFGDGMLTACKPISDDDLGRYIAGCLDRPERWNAVLPIGGPGPAITPIDQAEALAGLLGQPVRIKRVPVRLLDTIGAVLGTLGRVVPGLATKAELARIGRYYATESMLVLDPATGRYDADATPETGSEHLFDHYARLVRDGGWDERGDHAVF